MALKLAQRNFLTSEFLAAVSSWKSEEKEARKNLRELTKDLEHQMGKRSELMRKLEEQEKESAEQLRPVLTLKKKLQQEKKANQISIKRLEGFLAEAIEPLKKERQRIVKEKRKLREKLTALRSKTAKKEKSNQPTILLEKIKKIPMIRTMQSIERGIENLDKELEAIDRQITAKNDDFDNRIRPHKERIRELDGRLKSDCNEKIRAINKKKAKVKKQLAAIEYKEKAIVKEIEELKAREEQFKILGQVEIRIRNRQCQILFSCPNDLAAFIESQNHEPILLNGKLNGITDESYVFPEEPERGSYQSWEAFDRALKRHRAKVKKVRDRIAREREALEKCFELCSFYVYKNDLYFFDALDTHTSEEKILLIKQHHFKQEKKFERLRKEIRLFEKLESMEVQSREPIPEDIRFLVWRRDGGKCVKCGSRRDLEFDHIIPVSKGGSNTERNIQLLCQRCNREKHNKI